MRSLARSTGAEKAIRQDFDRNLALQASIARAVDDPHAAAAQLFEHFVRPDYLLHAINSVPFRNHLEGNHGFIQNITLSSGQSPRLIGKGRYIRPQGLRPAEEYPVDTSLRFPYELKLVEHEIGSGDEACEGYEMVPVQTVAEIEDAKNPEDCKSDDLLHDF